MKYKYLTKEQILISLDRLTRFKYTKDKYLRVYSDIISSCLQEPVIKKSDILKLAFSQITSIAEEIFNNSVQQFYENKRETKIDLNKFLKEIENKTFNNDKETQDLLNNNINYAQAIQLINNDAPINLLWLKKVSEGGELLNIRHKYNLKYPISKVLLVEGITEEILLPAFSKYLCFDFNREGIEVIPAGGKNQVVKMYYKMAEELKIPIFVLLDKDAEENIQEITPKLRREDKIHLVECGEFEDLLPKSLIVKTINKELNNFATISEKDLEDELPEAKNLENIFKQKGLHEFKKADFAKMVKENITEDSDISAEIAEIIMELGL